MCSFALYPFVVLAVQLMTLSGLVLPAGWVVRQSTETARSFIAQLVPPKTTRSLLGKPLGMISETFTVKYLSVECVCPMEVLVTRLYIFIEWSGVDDKSEVHSQARASFFKSGVQRLANPFDFRACDVVVSAGKTDHSEAF